MNRSEHFGSLDLQRSQVSGHLQIDTERIDMNEWDVMNCLICDLSMGCRGLRLFCRLKDPV